MKVFISSDHGGFDLKDKLTGFVKDLGHNVSDLGPFTLDPADDYPKYSNRLAKTVVENPGSFGILLCRNGVGVSIVANKTRGIRCALSFNPKHAASSRKDDDANVLSLPADYVTEEQAKKIVSSFLSTDFPHLERHERRKKEIEEIENTQ